MLTAKAFPVIRCPQCKVPMKYEEILFVSDWTVVVNGTCPKCRASLTSGPELILALVPSRDDEKAN